MNSKETTKETKYEYYPADLQERALEAYNALPESGTVVQLITQIFAEFSPRRSIKDPQQLFVGERSHVLVGWKNYISIEPLGDEAREVINIGTMQWFDEEEDSITVSPDGKYISLIQGSVMWETITDELAQDYRDLRWNIVR